MQNQMKFIFLQLGGMLLSMYGLLALDALNQINYVVVSFTWLLIVVEYTKPPIVRPRWHRRLRYIILLGAIIFVFVTLQRIEAITAPPTT